jgi:hypothetical protein
MTRFGGRLDLPNDSQLPVTPAEQKEQIDDYPSGSRHPGSA